MKNKIFKYLEKVQSGYLLICTPSGDEIEIGNKDSAIKADIKINNWEMFDWVMSKGDIGFGRAYIKGAFTTHNLANLLLFFSINQKELNSLFHSNFLYSAFFRFKNLFKKNSIKGSKKNINSHYDLGNNFYSLWLDKSMSYSSGIFYKEDSLEQAQSNKYKRILSKINKNSSNILEIGCGWGGFISTAGEQGLQVKGLTLSTNQQLYSRQLIKNKNLNSQVVLQDYRVEKGKFDNIVSIEMFEAVGSKYWDAYFIKIKECLSKTGVAVIQTITMNDAFYKKYSKTSDYIREYIFPGGFLTSPSIFKNLAKKHNLRILDEFKFGESYQKTVLKWLDNFNKVRGNVISLGYSQEFIKKWQFYLAHCAAGFGSKRTDVVQYSLTHS